MLQAQQTQTPPAAADEKERAASTSKASEDFRAWMAKSPAEKMRQAILHRMGLTEEELEALPPEERAKIEEQIVKEIQQEFEREASIFAPSGMRVLKSGQARGSIAKKLEAETGKAVVSPENAKNLAQPINTIKKD